MSEYSHLLQKVSSVSVNNFRVWSICLLFTTVVGQPSIFCQTRIDFPNHKETLNIWPFCEILEDKQNSYSIANILRDSSSLPFKSTEGIPPTFGFTSSSYWIKFKTNPTKFNSNVYLTIERTSLWEAELYFIEENGQIRQEHLGVNTPFKERSFRSKFAISRLGSSRDGTYYLKVRAITSLFIPIFFDSDQSLADKLTKVDLFNGLYVGIFLTIILYNAFALVFRKKGIYGWYLFYVFSLFVYQGLFNTGIGFEYIWPNCPEINKYYVISSSMFGISMIAFSAAFLDTREDMPKLHRPLFPLIAGFTVIIIASIMGFYLFSRKYFFWVLIPTFVYLFFIGVTSSRRGNINARFYLAGWGILLMFYFIFIVWLNGFIGESSIGHNALFLGSFFEMIFWFSAVSDRVNLSRKVEQDQEKKFRREAARDFHDEFGNQAARLISYVGLQRIRGNLTVDVYERLNTYAQNILDGAKDFVWALDPLNDNLRNTIIHLKDFGERLFSEKDITFRFYKLGNDNVNLPSGHSRQINLIFKEAITNSFKHSMASAVEMRVEINKRSAEIILKDNGRGMDNKIIHTSTRGLENIRTRSKKIGAELEIIATKNGTSLYLRIQTL
jgi:signal transduction histidine kinase